MAVKRCVEPIIKLAGLAGFILTEVNDIDVTVRVSAGLVIPESAAVIFVAPAATPVAIPLENMVAIAGEELIQTA